MQHLSFSPTSSVVLLVLAGAVGWVYVTHQRRQRRDEADLQALGLIRARVGVTLALITDPWRIAILEDDERETWPVTANTSVTVDTEGTITTTRGRNLAAKAVGGAATLGLGLFVFGNAKDRSVDNRELYITIELDDAVRVLKVPPSMGQDARHFAAMVNSTARRVANQS